MNPGRDDGGMRLRANRSISRTPLRMNQHRNNLSQTDRYVKVINNLQKSRTVNGNFTAQITIFTSLST